MLATHKSFAALTRLRKCSDSIPRSTRITLVKAFLYLGYFSGILLILSVELLLRMHRTKIAAVRCVAGIKKYE